MCYVVVVVLLHIHVQVVSDVQVHIHVMVVVENLKFPVKNAVSRSEKYHLVDLLLNLLVHHPIRDHLQAKIYHHKAFKQIKNKSNILEVACVRVAYVRKYGVAYVTKRGVANVSQPSQHSNGMKLARL